MKYLDRKGAFGRDNCRVLDIGCQHIFDILVEEGVSFLRRHGTTVQTDTIANVVESLVDRSSSPRWDIFFGQLLQLTDIDYTAYDIFPTERTHVFDLNNDSVPESHIESFDLVLNFGTTEHVFNQYRCFETIHQACKPQGLMFHQVPTVGYINHGYWVYSPQTFIDLAATNNYVVENLWVAGPQGSEHLEDYNTTPGTEWDSNGLPENNRSAWHPTSVPRGLINVLLRKSKSAPFRIPIDTSTAARKSEETQPDILARYHGS